MTRPKPAGTACCPSRRSMLTCAAAMLSLASLGAARAAGAAGEVAPADAGSPALAESDPAATAVHYVEDANRAADAQPGANCSNCVLYKDLPGTGSGGCKLFAGRRVKAGGWCSSWSDL